LIQSVIENDISDESILQELSRKPELLEVLYRRWGKRWTGLIFTAGVPASDIDDVLQAILLEVWQHAERFDPRRGSVESWLLQIARFRTIDHLRRVKPPLEVLTDAVADQRYDPIDADTRQWLNHAMALLTRHEARAIQLLYYYGFTQKEIARMWRVPHGTVKSWIRRGLAKLRDELAEERG
jgi:RNA polymerase sigma-70 factor (ECF subfamily)